MSEMILQYVMHTVTDLGPEFQNTLKLSCD